LTFSETLPSRALGQIRKGNFNLSAIALLQSCSARQPNIKNQNFWPGDAMTTKNQKSVYKPENFDLKMAVGT